MDATMSEPPEEQATKDENPSCGCSQPAIPPINHLRMQFTRKLRRIDDRRFRWAKHFYKVVDEDNEQWSQSREEWDNEVETAISGLKEQGHIAEAEELAGGLLADSRVTRPGKFTYQYLVPGGKWIVTIAGADVQDVSDDSDDASVSSNNDTDQSNHRERLAMETTDPLSLARPVKIDLSALDLPSVPLTHAKQDIVLTEGGPAYCLYCSCLGIPVPTLCTDGGPTHEILPKHITAERALEHFRAVHGEDFKGAGMRGLLVAHGKEVKAEHPNRWEIAAHNMTVRMRHRYAHSEWVGLLEQHQHRPEDEESSDEDELAMDLTFNAKTVLKTILRESLPAKVFTFRWPNPAKSDMITILCTNPSCASRYFPAHPLERRRAQRHFINHGLFLDEDEVVQLFGFKVISQHDSLRSKKTTVPSPSKTAAKAQTINTTVSSPSKTAKVRINKTNMSRKRACTRCVEFHLKCNRADPSCSQCSRSNKPCSYGPSGGKNKVHRILNRTTVYKTHHYYTQYLVRWEEFRDDPSRDEWVDWKDLGHVKDATDQFDNTHPLHPKDPRRVKGPGRPRGHTKKKPPVPLGGRQTRSMARRTRAATYG